MTKQNHVGSSDLYYFVGEMAMPLTEMYPFDLLYGIDTGEIPWSAISDGDQLTEEDVDVILKKAQHGELKTTVTRYRVECPVHGQLRSDMSEDGLFKESAPAERTAGYHEGLHNGAEEHHVDVETVEVPDAD